jgi:hypothetical protein
MLARIPKEASFGRRSWVRATGGEIAKYKKYNLIYN